MQALKERLEDFSQRCQAHTNPIMLYISIPAILFGTLLFLSWFALIGIQVNFSWFAVVALLIYYFLLDLRLASIMAIILIIANLICTWIAFSASAATNIILFVILFFGGWILQFLAQRSEKKKKSLTVDCCLNNFIIAPMYLLIEGLHATKLAKHLGIEPHTKKKESDNKQNN